MAKKHPVYGRMLRMGMVGGGPGAFIGDVHRKAARMDGQIELVAGVFSSSSRKSKQTGREQFVDPKRTYGSYQEMIAGELALPDDQRIDFVSIVTPNHLHFPVARDFLLAGFHVVCDKPMTFNVKEAQQLKRIVEQTGKVFALTHNYTGYPMVKLARDMIRQRDLGKILKVVVKYPQGWLIKRIEKMGAKQAEWRTDPKRSGASACMGDIGTHAENLVEYMTDLKIKRICADLTKFVNGRLLDDDGNCLVQFEGGAKGVLYASQISIGKENDLTIDVFGDKKSLRWRQEDPNYLLVRQDDVPNMTWSRGNDYVARKSAAAARATRLPAGHPEGFFEAFANIYLNAAETIRASIAGVKPDPLAHDFPTVDDGLRGMQFIEAVVKSAKGGAKWVTMPK
jgi:predicted dehydrogenase